MHHPPKSQEAPRSHKYRAREKPKKRSRISLRSYKKSPGPERSCKWSTDSSNRGRFSRRNHVRNQAKNRRRSWQLHSSPEPQIEYPAKSVESLTAFLQTVTYQDITTSNWLYQGAYVGNETRTIEFKKGGGLYLLKIFFKEVLVYGCAFLNSEGGSLVVGVNDKGIVCGVRASHIIEDEARKRVDCAMLLLKPALFPFNYSLRFLPVLKPGQQNPDLKVVCLTFKAPSAFSEPVLYSYDKGKVFMRRDASVQGPLGLPVIIEWYRQKFPHWMNHCLCNVLSRGPPFVDHRSMMDRILAVQNNEDQESEEEYSDSPASPKSVNSPSQSPVRSLDTRGRCQAGKQGPYSY